MRTLTDSEMVVGVAMLLLARQFRDNKPDPFNWDRIFTNIAAGKFTFGDDVKRSFQEKFAKELEELQLREILA